MKKIVLFDPSLGDNNGSHSKNLGDLIIIESVIDFLNTYFKDVELIRISTHVPISNKKYKLIKNADLKFVGGTNLLSSNIQEYNQWKSSYYKFIVRLPIVRDAILFGVGWWQYQDRPTKYTANFYSKLLSSSFLHSVRDSYSLKKVNEVGIVKCLNTSCPTTWSLNGINTDREKSSFQKDVLFMLTDYHPNNIIDNNLINILLQRFNKIYFFPQGIEDLNYLKSLEKYKKNISRFQLLNHDINDLNRIVKNNTDLVYIGTRLHGGIKCLQNNIPSLILANDNRSIEIGKDINLAVSYRDNHSLIINWIEEKTNFGKILLPTSGINKWKEQF